MSPFQQQTMSSCALIVRSVMTQALTYREPCESEEWEKEFVKKCQKLTPTHHTSMFVHLVLNMRASWVHPQLFFTANHHDSGQNSKHLVTTLLSPLLLQCWHLRRHLVPPSTRTFYRHVHLSAQPSDAPSRSRMHALTQLNDTQTQRSHWGYTPTNVTFNRHSLSRKSHAYMQHSPTQGTMLRVKRRDPDGSHLVCADGLLRWLRTGYGHTHRWRPTESGREMDVLTIDLLRSMIHNLVIWHWESCTHWAGTLTWHIGHTSLRLCRVRVN